MTGSDILRARKALGWSRTTLARRADLEPTRIATLERGGRALEGEHESLREVLKTALGEVLTTSASIQRDGHAADLAGTEWDPGVLQLEEWNGLRNGDVVRLADDPKVRRTYTFLRYFKNPAQEYVEVRAANGATRPVRPERVMRKEGARWVPATA